MLPALPQFGTTTRSRTVCATYVSAAATEPAHSITKVGQPLGDARNTYMFTTSRPFRRAYPILMLGTMQAGFDALPDSPVELPVRTNSEADEPGWLLTRSSHDTMRPRTEDRAKRPSPVMTGGRDSVHAVSHRLSYARQAIVLRLVVVDVRDKAHFASTISKRGAYGEEVSALRL